MLAEIYNWFTEGFDTADRKDAKALLEAANLRKSENSKGILRLERQCVAAFARADAGNSLDGRTALTIHQSSPEIHQSSRKENSWLGLCDLRWWNCFRRGPQARGTQILKDIPRKEGLLALVECR